MKMRSNRRTEREAVNAVRSFFESCDYVCQEVDLANDYGKDLYLDVTDGDQVTGLCIAVQVKGGASYKRKDHYVIPVNASHAGVWRQSSLPVAGVVYDPHDRQIRWCNISRYLNERGDNVPQVVRVDSNRILSRETLQEEFVADFHEYHNLRSIGLAALQLTSTDAESRNQALIDCFVLGRADARVLVLIRELLHTFDGDTLRLAIQVLGHATPHPDIFWHKGNWIPPSTCEVVCKRFRWSISDLCRLLVAASQEEWHRGGFGQMVYSLICLDPEIETKIEEAAFRFSDAGDLDNAFWCMYLAVYWASDQGRAKLELLLKLDSRLGSHELVPELRCVLEQHNQVSLFE